MSQEEKKANDPIALEQEEVQRIVDVDQRWKAIVQELGSIELSDMGLQDRKESVNRFIQETKDLEQKAARLLEEKYGKGSVDMKAGTFTPFA